MKGLSAAHNPTNVGEIQYFSGTALILLMLTQLCMDCVLIIIIHLQFSCIETCFLGGSSSENTAVRESRKELFFITNVTYSDMKWPIVLYWFTVNKQQDYQWPFPSVFQPPGRLTLLYFVDWVFCVLPCRSPTIPAVTQRHRAMQGRDGSTHCENRRRGVESPTTNPKS